MRWALLQGVEEMTRAVAATYGPRGRTVMLDRAGGLLSTKDGATVAWEIEPDDPGRRLGTRVLQEACAKVNSLCGDGTTTTAILVHAILRESFKWVAAGANPALLAADLRRVAEELDECALWDVTRPMAVEDEGLLLDVARTASNRDEEVAQAIVEAISRTGSEGMVIVEEGTGRGVEIEVKSGLESDRGWESSEMCGPDGSTRHLALPLVALVDARLTTMKQVVPILEAATQFPHPLVIVSHGVFGDAIKLMVANDRKLHRADGGKFEVIAVRCPGGDHLMRGHLGDLAALTGATILDPAVGSLEHPPDGFLGSAQTVTASATRTTFVGFPDKYELIEVRVEQLRRERDAARHSHDAEEIRTRIAKLTDGLCILRVGGSSSVEIRERRGRIEDALSAVRMAVEGGVMPGAGIAYLTLANFLEAGLGWSEDFPQFATSGLGDKVLVEALKEPLRTLARNAGCEPEVILERVLEAATEPGATTPSPGWRSGWDATTNAIRDLRDNPIICDPSEVVKAAILTAISTAATLLTAEVALTRVEHHE
jgi:chaperonin GroEL